MCQPNSQVQKECVSRRSRSESVKSYSYGRYRDTQERDQMKKKEPDNTSSSVFLLLSFFCLVLIGPMLLLYYSQTSKYEQT